MLTSQTATAQENRPDSVGTSTGLHRLPLMPGRVVRFRVSEGTWMSLDISPDGQTIVFDLLGDLYTLPITGGVARRLTSGMAVNQQPRYSPDGQHLVFVSDRSGSANLWIADRQGRHARRLSQLRGYDGAGAVTSPAWSPDGRTVLVSQKVGATRSNGASAAQAHRWLLASYDVRTQQMRWLSDTTHDRGHSALGPAYSPQGKFVYAAIDGFRPEPRSDANWRIARIDAVTGHIEPALGAEVGRTSMRPAVSPDGRFLVYASSSGSRVGLRIRDFRTDRERWLVTDVLDNPPITASENRDLAPGYAFTPDSRALVVAYGGKIHRIELATARAAAIPFVVDVERLLGPLTVHQFTLPDTAVRTRNVLHPALAPDGTKVAFSALDRIWVMELPHDGRPAGQPRRLTVDSIGEFYPSWSPDGCWLAYTTWRDAEGGAVRRARVPHEPEGPPAPSERLTVDTALYFHTAVGPGGRRVVAVRAALPLGRVLTDNTPLDYTVLKPPPPLDPSLVWVPASGGRTRTIASLTRVYSRWLTYPVDQVYFTADPNRIHVGLTSWAWDGGDRRAALVVTGRLRSGELTGDPVDFAGVLSLDERRALITRKRTLFELGLPAMESPQLDGPDTIDLERARLEPLGAAAGAASRWGTALAPWVSWSRDGRRVLFNQGATLFVGSVKAGRWTVFDQVEVPLLVPPDIPRGTIVFHGARLITMRGREVIERGDLVVRDNRIVAVGAVGKVAIPRDAQLLDVSGATILPGFVDIHDHPLLPKGVHPGQCWQCLVRLAYGVTAIRDPEPHFSNDIFAYQERERTGDLLGPRVFSTGMADYGTDPPPRTLNDARDVVRPNAEYFSSETFKIYYDESTDRRSRQLLAMAMAERRLNATAHTNGVELELVGVLDGISGIEHAPQIRTYDDVAALTAKSGTIHTMTYSGVIFGSLNYMVRRHGWPMERVKMRRFVPPSEAAATCIAGCTAERISVYGPMELDNLLSLVGGSARIAARGGRIGMGSHGNMPALGFHYEMWLHALGGMPNHEILRSATISGSAAIGHGRDFGTIEVGKLADLQVLHRSPLDDIQNTTSILYVMKNGRLYNAENLAEIWPRRKELGPIYLYGSGSWPDAAESNASKSYGRKTLHTRPTSPTSE